MITLIIIVYSIGAIISLGIWAAVSDQYTRDKYSFIMLFGSLIYPVIWLLILGWCIGENLKDMVIKK